MRQLWLMYYAKNYSEKWKGLFLKSDDTRHEIPSWAISSQSPMRENEAKQRTCVVRKEMSNRELKWQMVSTIRNKGILSGKRNPLLRKSI